MANDRELVKVHARAFQSTSDLAAVSTPSEGRLLDVNESFVRITGYDRDELIGRATDELGLWVDPEQRRRILTQLQHAASVTGVDVALRAKDGTVRDLRGSAELVEAGDDQYVLTIAKDLSEEVARRSELSGTRRTVRSLTEERRRLSARHDLAVREERARISRELHDSTLQNLAAARLRFYLLEEALGAVNRAELERLEEAIEAAASSTQALIFELRRPMLERYGLAATLELALEKLATRAGLAHEVRDRLSEPPPVEVATIAHEMVRQVLSFVELHARASRVEVELEGRDGGLLIAIFDDGAGSEPTDVSGSHGWRQSALDPIRERLNVIGGRLDVARSPGQGTTVELWIPIDAGPGIGGRPGLIEEV